MSEYQHPQLCNCDCGCVRVVNIGRTVCSRCEDHR